MAAQVALIEANGIATVITIHRPDRRNALSRELVAELTRLFTQAAADSSRCVILTGAGSAFCAGMDLAELADTLDQPGEAERVHEDAGRLASLFELIYLLPKPTIAAVNGPAVAGGAGLASVCDLAVADPAAKFGYPEVKRGLVAAMVMPHLLRHVGDRTARDLLLTGRLIGAEEARAAGLINAVVTPPETALQRAHGLAKEFAESAPQALAATKRILAQCRATPAHSSPSTAGKEGVGGLPGESAQARLQIEAKEGLRAFLQKRPAPWLPAP
jgi:methylglutaconyl-CoA hydratase